MKTILWNVDTQKDFMRPDGALYVQDAELIEPNLAKLTRFARENGYQVVNTADWHNQDTEEISDNPDFVQTFPAHCMQGSSGAEYVLATRPMPGYFTRVDWQADSRETQLRLGDIAHGVDAVLYKDRFDVFSGNRHTESVLEAIQPDRAIVYGVATNVCVDFAVRGLLERGVEVYVVRDAIKELPHLPVEETLGCWKDMGAKYTTTADVLTD